MALGMPLGGWLSDRIQSRFGWRAARGGIAASALIISAMLLLLGVNAKELFWNVTLLSLALGVLGTLEGPFWVTAVEVGRGRGGLSTGIFNTGGNIGGIVAPVLTPWISKDLELGWEYAMGVGSLICILGAILWIWIDDPNERSLKGDSSPALPHPAIPLAAS
jgi:MFS family permease